MLRSLFLLFFCTSLSLSAQVYEKGFGLEVSPHFGNRRVSAGSGITFTELERQDSLESGRLGYNLGFTYDIRADRIGFTTGIRYLETGYEIAQQPAFSEPGGDALTFSGTVRSTYVSLPLAVNFHQNITDKDRVLFTFGVAANMHLKTRVLQTNFSNGVETGTEEIPNDPEVAFRSPVISFNTGVGFDRKLGDYWTLRLQPNFNFFLQGNQREDVNRTNRNYYQVGVRIVVRRLIGVLE